MAGDGYIKSRCHMPKRSKPGSGRGGARKGAGRTPYPPDVVAYLATRRDKTRTIAEAVRASQSYRAWAVETGRLAVLPEDAAEPQCE